MDPTFFTPPAGFEEEFADGSEWKYGSHRGHNFVRVVGVLYDQSGIREEDKILTVNVTIRTGYDSNSQYRTGKMTARSRHDFGRRYVPRPPLRWLPNTEYRLTKGDGGSDRTWRAVHVFDDGSAVLVPVSGHSDARKVSADERQYWREDLWDDSTLTDDNDTEKEN